MLVQLCARFTREKAFLAPPGMAGMGLMASDLSSPSQPLLPAVGISSGGSPSGNVQPCSSSGSGNAPPSQAEGRRSPTASARGAGSSGIKVLSSWGLDLGREMAPKGNAAMGSWGGNHREGKGIKERLHQQPQSSCDSSSTPSSLHSHSNDSFPIHICPSRAELLLAHAPCHPFP